MTFLYNTEYTITATVSNDCGTSAKSISLTIVSYPVTTLSNPSATIFNWWSGHGELLGCSSCIVGTTSTCESCMGSLQLSDGICSCASSSSYVDLSQIPDLQCIDKTSIQASWSLASQNSPNYEMQIAFNGGFSQLSQNLDIAASMVSVSVDNAAATIQQIQSSRKNQNISLTFEIQQDLTAGATLVLTQLSQYNSLLYSPFIIANPSLTYNIPDDNPTKSDDNPTKSDDLPAKTEEIITKTGSTANVAMQVQMVAASLIPFVTGGLSTSAVLLLAFLSEVDIYKYTNVPFPNNFVVFCEQLSTDFIPNPIAPFDDVNEGQNPNSTYGQFQFWGVSMILLDNSAVPIIRVLFALSVILLTVVLTFTLQKWQKIANFFRRVRDVFMWNTFLSFYLGDYTELQLNSMIQLRENIISSRYAYLSLGFSILIVVSYALLLFYLAYVLNRRKKLSRRSPTIKERPSSGLSQSSSRNSFRIQELPSKKSLFKIQIEEMKWVPVPKCLCIISEDFKEDNRFTRNFFLIMTLQSLLLIFNAFFLQNFGLIQAIIYTVLTLLYFISILWKKPFSSKVQTGMLLFNQAAKIAMGAIAIALGVNERTQTLSQEAVSSMGLALIVLISSVIGINALISVMITLVSTFIEIKKWCAKRKNKNKKLPTKRIKLDPGATRQLLDVSSFMENSYAQQELHNPNKIKETERELDPQPIQSPQNEVKTLSPVDASFDFDSRSSSHMRATVDLQFVLNAAALRERSLLRRKYQAKKQVRASVVLENFQIN